jgi:AAA domain
MTLSADPTQMVGTNEAQDVHVEAQLPCGPVQMANALYRAFVRDDFHFSSAMKPTREPNLSDEGFDILRRGKATKEKVLKRLHGCMWQIGGGVVLQGFEQDLIAQIKGSAGLYHTEAIENIDAMEQLSNIGGSAELSFAIGGDKIKDRTIAHKRLECFQHSVRNGHLFYHQYLDKNGRFIWNMPHITEVADGWNVIPRDVDDPKSVDRFKTIVTGDIFQCIQSYMIPKACAELREIQYQVANHNALNIERHRAYVVATSPLQLVKREQREGSEIYTVFVTLRLHGRDLVDLLPPLASVLSIQWESSIQGQFEEPSKRWRGPVIQPPSADLDGCHFAMLAHANKNSVMPKAHATLADAKLASGLPIRLTYEMKDEIPKEMRDAFKSLFKPEYREFALLLMGRYDEAAKVFQQKKKIVFPVKNDEFSRTRAEREAWEKWADWVMDHSHLDGVTKWNLNDEQLEGINKLSNPEPIIIVRGPPGTGKSFFGACAIWSILAAEDGQGKILVVASSNEATDAIAQKITTNRPKDPRMKDALVIRLHVQAAEYHHAQSHEGEGTANPTAERRNQDSERVRNLRSTFQLVDLQEFTPARMKDLSDSAKQAHSRHIALYGHSLAQAIWRETVIIHNTIVSLPLSERDEADLKAISAVATYRRTIQDYRGQVLGDDEEAEFRKAYQFLARYVLMKASIVITTCYNAATYKVFECFQPNYLVADECGQLTDAELIMALTACSSLRKVLLLGDPTQLEPTVTSITRNEFSMARKSTFITRALGRVDSTHLVVQYRMTPAIADPLNIIFCQGMLQNAEGLARPGPLTLMVRRFISEYLWKDTKKPQDVKESVFVDVPNSKAWKDVDGESRINVPEAKCIVATIKALFNYDRDLVRRFTVAVIAMYKSQATLIRTLLKEAVGKLAAAVDVIDISTVDSFQGKENPIVLLSMVLHGNDALVQRISTHLQDSHRLCLAISRAKFGFFVIGNFLGLKSSTDPARSGNLLQKEIPLFSLLKYYERRNQVFHYGNDVFIDDSEQRREADFQQKLEISIRDNRTGQDAEDVRLGNRNAEDSSSQINKLRR